MNHRLVLVLGPSGVGKDTILNWLRSNWLAGQAVHWVRRTITRPSQADAEAHEGVDAASFASIQAQGGFALHWSANGLQYGIRHDEMLPLQQGAWVILNGSREHLPVCAARYPGLTVVHISADPAVVRQRLKARGRESDDEIEARIQRQVPLRVPTGCQGIEILNNSSIAQAGSDLLQALMRLDATLGAAAEVTQLTQ